jgi:hypothetical protein
MSSAIIKIILGRFAIDGAWVPDVRRRKLQNNKKTTKMDTGIYG